jgi:hypothetical protein
LRSVPEVDKLKVIPLAVYVCGLLDPTVQAGQSGSSKRRRPDGLSRTRTPGSAGAAVPVGTLLVEDFDLIVEVRVVDVNDVVEVELVVVPGRH